MESPTKKQIEYIRDIEEYLHVRFCGKTKQDATKWLSEYSPMYQIQRELEMETMYDLDNAMDRV